MSEGQQGLRVIELHTENVKRIVAATVTPDPGQPLVVITGRNGQGKSSLIDSMIYALGGGKQIPDEPIRNGERDASVTVDIGDFVITRTWTKKGSRLFVENKNGDKLRSPQDILDKLTGTLTFDPFAFSRLKPAEQVAWLTKITGLDFTELDAKKERLREERVNLNRAVKGIEGELAAIPRTPAGTELPGKEVSVSDLSTEYSAAVGQQSRNEEEVRSLAHTRTEYVRLKGLRDQALEEAEEWRVAMSEQVELGRELVSKVDSHIQPDIDEIKARMDGAEAMNVMVRDRDRSKDLTARIQKAQLDSDQHTRQMEDIEREKVGLVRAAKMPVDSLSFNADGVRVDDVPFEQASQAEQLRISVAMGLASNPKLRVMFIKDGSLLDEDSMALLAQLAEENDAQIWIERVDNSGKIGIVIEDGMVVGSELTAVLNNEN